jgi:hypothetical protein
MPVDQIRSRRSVVGAVVIVFFLVTRAEVVLADSSASSGGVRDLTRDWAATLSASLRLLVLEHGVRLATESKTRQALAGSFLGDYTRSVRWPRQWSDGDGWQVNYVGHPVHGAAAVWLWLEHAPPRAKGLRPYMTSRATAAMFAGLYSLQFEMGPLSEASVGNIGLRPETIGWADHVVTPIGAFGVMLLEDVLDRSVLPWVERKTSNPIVRALARMALNPGKGVAHLSQGRAPWTKAPFER